jgi:hypothetical protein
MTRPWVARWDVCRGGGRFLQCRSPHYWFGLLLFGLVVSTICKLLNADVEEERGRIPGICIFEGLGVLPRIAPVYLVAS